MGKGNANAWRNKWLGLLLAGALVVTGLPGWAPQAAAQPADSAAAVEATEGAVDGAGIPLLGSDEQAPGSEGAVDALEAGVPQTGASADPAATGDGSEVSLQAAGAALSVAEAIAKGNSGEAVEVAGIIVGHATGSLTADFEAPFGNDFNFLIADQAGEQDKAKLIDVQVPSGLRANSACKAIPI